jgi:hypothetical protein
MLTFSRRLISQVSLGDERRVRARDPRRSGAIEVATSCVPSAVPAADLRFGGVVGPSWFLRAAGDFPNNASELPGSSTGRCAAGSALQFVCCVFGVIPNAKTHFGLWGGVAISTIRNNLIADLLFLRKYHAPAQSLPRLGPRSWVVAPCPGFPQVQARKRGRVPCSHRIWTPAVLHGITGRRKNRKEEARPLKKRKGKYYSFLNTQCPEPYC